MTLAEALDHGRRIKNEALGMDEYFSVNDGHTFSIRAVCSESWEVEPEPREPKEIWVNEYLNKSAVVHISKEKADNDANGKRIACTHYREVL